jgi:glycosyltransferase involved in cell wall biosynthesis
MTTDSIAAIVLTKNEAIHLRRCLRSLQGIVDQTFVVDSFSTDGTLDIARSEGAQVVQNPWTNYATQFNFALDTLPIATDWVMRIDADEFVEGDLEGLKRRLAALPSEVTGLMLRRKMHFLGRWIRHGGMHPLWHLRMWRSGRARCEARWMDEHMILLSGTTASEPVEIVDDNKNSLTWWTEKHNSYASREAVDLLNLKYHFLASGDHMKGISGVQATGKRWIKEVVYRRLPPFFRAGLYFLYRFVVRLGFLDGRQGWTYHFLQGFWYRALVDFKVQEVENEYAKTQRPLPVIIKEKFGLVV